MPVPVLVIGNITVGGTGKTPLALHIIEQLKARGWRPGIVSRGYGGNAPSYPFSVSANTDPELAGDEPVLLAARSGCPLVVDPVRSRAGITLVTEHKVNVIISDDGLQHYALARDLEIVVVDDKRRFGNGMLLPAGPLRESPNRLARVDAVLVNGASGDEAGFELEPGSLRQVGGQQEMRLEELRGQKVHAVAAIGYPERFFSTLEQSGIQLLRHAFPDHHAFTADDVQFDDELKILMTEKDAVKCRLIANDKFWYLPVSARPNLPGDECLQKIFKSLGSPPA